MQNGYIESFNGKFRDKCLNNGFKAFHKQDIALVNGARTTTKSGLTTVLGGFLLHS